MTGLYTHGFGPWQELTDRKIAVWKSEPLSFQDAETLCREYGGQLLTETLRSDISNFLVTETDDLTQTQYWVGATRVGDGKLDRYLPSYSNTNE